MRISAFSTPISTVRKRLHPVEWEYLQIQRRVNRQKYFAYLADAEYKAVTDNSLYQNVGLLSLCSSLEQDGHDVAYFGGSHDRVANKQLQRIAASDIVLISSYTCNFTAAISCARRLRRLNHTLLIGIGGHHAPHIPLEALQIDGGKLFDFTMRGYSENAIRLLAKVYSSGGVDAFSHIPQTAYIDSSGQFVNNVANDYPSLSTIPLPANHLVAHPRGLVFARVFSAYGCPHACTMCNLGVQDSFSKRPLAAFKNEVEYLVKERGTRFIYIGDPTIAVSIGRFRQISSILGSFGELRWGGQTRMQTAGSAEFRAILADSSCIHMEIGVESSSQALLDNINKRTDVETFDETLYSLREQCPSLHIETNWMFAIPGSTQATIRRDAVKMREYIRNGIDCELYMFVPFPGTPYYEDPGRFGIKIVDRDYDNFTMYGRPVFEQVSGMSQPDLYAAYLSTLRELCEAFRQHNRGLLSGMSRVHDGFLGWLFG